MWVIGASSGIGKALAEKFSSEGWEVAVSARRKEILDEMANEKNVFSYPLDVTNQEKINEAFEKIIKDFNYLDICICCSGSYERKLEKDINVDQIKKTTNINFFGVVQCVKAVENYFKNKKQGHISIVSSVAAYRGLPNSTGYGPSKAALTNFTESIYFDFKKYGVKVSLISPGFIKTPMTDKNDFPMPFIKTPQFAANKIYKSLTKQNKFEIHFPLELTFMLKILRILPYKIYLYLIHKFVKR